LVFFSVFSLAGDNNFFGFFARYFKKEEKSIFSLYEGVVSSIERCHTRFIEKDNNDKAFYECCNQVLGQCSAKEMYSLFKFRDFVSLLTDHYRFLSRKNVRFAETGKDIFYRDIASFLSVDVMVYFVYNNTLGMSLEENATNIMKNYSQLLYGKQLGEIRRLVNYFGKEVARDPRRKEAFQQILDARDTSEESSINLFRDIKERNAEIFLLKSVFTREKKMNSFFNNFISKQVESLLTHNNYLSQNRNIIQYRKFLDALNREIYNKWLVFS
jgi:hypothetical protein